MPILKDRGELGYILICMNLINFDKLGLLALVKPVGLAAEPLATPKRLLYHLQTVS